MEKKMHSDFSPSSFERRVNCPASYTMEKDLPSEDSTASLMGTDYHAKVAEALKEGKASDDWMVDKCVDVANRLFEELEFYYDTTVTYIEQRFELKFLDDVINFGTIDFCCVDGNKAMLIDWKFGYDEVTDADANWQLKWYVAFLMSRHPEVEDVTTLIFNPRIGQYTRTTFNKENVTKEVVPSLLKAIEVCKSETERFSCGSHCRYCKARKTCPAFNACADRYMMMGDSQDLTMWTDDKLVAYYDKIGIVKQVIDNVTEELKRRALENGHCGKYEVKEQSAGFDVVDTKSIFKRLMERGMTMEDILDCCKVSLTPVFDAIYSIDKLEDKKVTKKLSKDNAIEFLGSEITPKKNITKIVEVKIK